MKLIYSYLQKFLPDLSIKPEQLRDDLTMIGHFANFFEKIDDEIVFDLDIKVNRGDCLGYYGLAKDLSIFYNIPIKNLSQPITPSTQILPIKVTTDNVKRVMSIKISDLKNSSSPQWLQTFLKCHNTKSINTLVDLTNYIMFLYGIPCHAFDTAKSGQNLIWEMNSKFKEFISLDGSKLILDNKILMINNPDQTLSLSFWGGESCAIDNSTTETIIELAIYDRTTVRQNSRQLKSVTEASIRLEKDLDPELIPTAFNHLINLILENCDGQITSQIFDYYPNKSEIPVIKFDSQKPTLISGIDIPKDFSIDILTRLGCQINNDLITPPSIRKDITIEADLIEEVIRFYGYQKIPTNQPLSFKEIGDITPPEIYLIEKLKDDLIKLGYDEVLTWPLVTSPTDESTVIKTQNSINSEAIYLRQSLIPSLEQQLDQYTRFKLPNPQFFEIGKIFNLKDSQFIENNSLCISSFDNYKLMTDVENIFNKKFNSFNSQKIQNQLFVEIVLDNLKKPLKYIPNQQQNNAIELTSQIITLDANITLEEKSEPVELIKKYSQKIDPKILWSVEIIDVYQNRYTFRVNYFNCDDKTAKSIHLKTFNLE